MKAISHILFYELLQGKILNAVVFPFAWIFREWARKKKFWLPKFLWGFLHDGNDYGDADFLPDKKNGFWKAYMWALRNPLHNRYYKNKKNCVEKKHTGYVKCKNTKSLTSWRTFKTETGSRNGKIIDFERSLFGKQRIYFDIIYEDGEIKKGKRNSVCIPFRFFSCIVIHSRRYGYESGLKQSSFNFAFRFNSNNIENFKNWKKSQYIRKELK